MSEEALPPAATPVGRSYRNLMVLKRPQCGLTDDARAARCDAISTGHGDRGGGAAFE